MSGTPKSVNGASELAQTFGKHEKLLDNRAYRRVYDTGKRVSGSLFTAFLLRQPDQTVARFGFTVPRALGKATKRNRIKRRLREAVRLEKWRVAPCWQIVINPRRSLLDAPFEQIRREVERLFSQCAPSS